MTAGPVRKSEAEAGHCHARNRGWKPLPEQLAASDLAVLIHNWEVFVVHQILSVSSLPRPPKSEFRISDFEFAVGLRPTRRTVACGRLIASSFR
jgi:hypothetical protein